MRHNLPRKEVRIKPGMVQLTGPVGSRSRVRSRLTSFRVGLVEAGLKPGDLAEPAVEPGFLNSVFEVSDDLNQPRSRGRVEPEAGAAYAGLTEMILSWAIVAQHRV
jgi:hypothetical protein